MVLTRVETELIEQLREITKLKKRISVTLHFDNTGQIKKEMHVNNDCFDELVNRLKLSSIKNRSKDEDNIS